MALFVLSSLLLPWSAFGTPTEKSLLPYNPDLSGDQVIDASDLILLIQAWMVRDVYEVIPTPTPTAFQVSGFVTSASDNMGVQNATVLAGTNSVFTSLNGFFELTDVSSGLTEVIVARDGFHQQTVPVEAQFPVTVLNVILYPLGMTPPTPTPTSTLDMTLSPSASPTQTSATSTPTFTLSPTVTKTPFPPTSTRTPTVTATPTPPPLLGVWRGDLQGSIFIGTDLIWDVNDGVNANAVVGQPSSPIQSFFGNYTKTGNSVHYSGQSFSGDTLVLDMTWDGADEFTTATFSANIAGHGSDSGTVTGFERSYTRR